MVERGKGRGRGRKDVEEEEENHRNPFLSINPNFKPSSSKLQFRKELSRARWDKEMGMAVVVEKKGSMWATTGIVRNGNLYCHVEEIFPCSLEKGSLGATARLLLCDLEVSDSSHGNNLLRKMQGYATYNRPKWSDPSPDPAHSRSLLLRAAPFPGFSERGALLLSEFNDTILSIKDIYKKISYSKDGCSWDCFEAYRHLKSLGYIVGRYGIPWTLKSAVDCCSSASLQHTPDSDRKSCDEVENSLSTLFKDMQLEEMKPMFCVYPPNSKFRKSSPGNPSFLLCVLRDNPPSRVEVESLEEKCDGIPLKSCFVDHGRISFFRYDKVTLPVLP